MRALLSTQIPLLHFSSPLLSSTSRSVPQQYRSYGIVALRSRSSKETSPGYSRIEAVDAETRRAHRHSRAPADGAQASRVSRDGRAPSRTATGTRSPFASSERRVLPKIGVVDAKSPFSSGERRTPKDSSEIRRMRPLAKDELIDDPKRLAQRVLQHAEGGDRLRALSLVRAAPSSMKTVVSWNALIDHAFKLRDVGGAFRTYNEMKKRGIEPNELTYSILFAGLAENTHLPTCVPRALKLYDTMKEATDRKFRPNQIHTNALLNVLARAGEVDRLVQIASSLPARGPDTITYTTIFDGLRLHYAPEEDTRGEQEVGRKRATVDVDVIEDAKRIWQGVLTRWKNGSLMLDEKLVCSMCRLLLASARTSDWLEVFSMVEQIYKIPNPVTKKEQPTSAEQARGLTDQSSTPPAPSTKMKAVLPPGPQVGNATLSLLIEASAQIKSVHAGETYWDHFHNLDNIRLDLENYHSYLRFLRKFRAGKQAADLAEYMVAKSMTPDGRTPSPSPKTFYIALSACKRPPGGRTNLYQEAVRILDAFEEMGIVEIPEERGRRVKKYLGFQKRRALVGVRDNGEDDTAFISKVYTMFLSTASVIGDPMVLKQALRRVTSGEEERNLPISLPSYYQDRRTKKVPTYIPQKQPKKTPNPFFDLPSCLSSSLASYATRETTNELVQSLIGVAKRLLNGADISWGHGEREALLRNEKLLNEAVAAASKPGARRGPGAISGSGERKDVKDTRRVRSSIDGRYRSSTRTKWGNSADGGPPRVAEDDAASWEPSSKRDRQGKKEKRTSSRQMMVRSSRGASDNTEKLSTLDEKLFTLGEKPPKKGLIRRGFT